MVTRTDLIARLRDMGIQCCDMAADALTASQERIEELTKAMGTIEAGIAFIAVDATSEDARMAARLLPIARAALDATDNT